MSAVIDVRGLWRIYETAAGHTTALRGVSLQVARGEFLAIMGGTTMFVGVLCTLCYAFAPQLKRMNLLSAPKNNDVGIARWILIGSMMFCDAIIIGIVVWFTSIALSAV